MKNHKARVILAVAATSLALVLSGATPASASVDNGSISCPSNMAARVSFTSTYSGAIDWYTTGGTWFRSNTWGANNGNVTYRTYVATRTGPVKWNIPNPYAHGDIYATCVF